jgi:hypothetical protein
MVVVTRIAQGVGALVLWILIGTLWLPWLIWFLPVAVMLAYFAGVRPNWPEGRFLLSICTAGVGTGVWALLLLNVVGPNLPPALQHLLVMHIDPTGEPVRFGRYLVGGMSSGEFLGYIALMSIGSFTVLEVLGVQWLCARARTRQRRIWLIRFAVVAVVGGSVILVYAFFRPWWVLFGFVSYLAAIGFLISGDDPLDETSFPSSRSEC